MRHAAYFIAALLILVPFAALADDAPSLLIGGTARITASGATTACLPTKDDVDAATKAAAAGDRIGFAQAIADGIYLPNGTRVRGIDAGGFMYSLIQVRVESGDNIGAACWLPQGVGIFKDIVAPSS
jgi:hypothetical protein